MHNETQSTFGSTLEEAGGAPPKPLTQVPTARHADEGITPGTRPEGENVALQEVRLKFAEETHQYVIEYIRLADRKAIFFFAGSTALLAYLQRLGLSNAWLVSLSSWRLLQVLAFLATVGLILCAIACITVVIPRLGGSGTGIIFFHSVAKYKNATDYATVVSQKTAQELCEEKLKHTYDLAAVCDRKYGALKLGQWIGAVASVATLILFVVHTGPTF